MIADFIASLSPSNFLGLILSITVSVIALSILAVKHQVKMVAAANRNFKTTRQIEAPEFPSESMAEGTQQAIDQLVKYAKEIDPDCIVGVHAGGRLVSALVCEELDIPEHHCGYFSTDLYRDREPQLFMKSNSLHGKVLVIDDVIRTGSTLEMIRRKITHDTFYKKMDVDSSFFAALVVAEDRRKFSKGYFFPDWLRFKTKRDDEQLPWSRLNAGIRMAMMYKNKDRDFDEYMIAVHDRLIKDVSFALYCVNLAMRDEVKFEKLLDNKELLSDSDK